MLAIAVLDKAANPLNQVMPWVSGISSPEQYQALLATMEVLIEDDDAHQPSNENFLKQRLTSLLIVSMEQ